MKHAIIGSNIIDRLVKCPGSLKCGNGSLAEKDEKRNKPNYYTKNRIECNEATDIGLKVDEMSKAYLRRHFEKPIASSKYVKDIDYCNTDLTTKAKEYCRHMINLRNIYGKCVIDPAYDLSKYMTNVDGFEFRVVANPDFMAFTDSNRNGTVYISDLTTGNGSNSRNKMFQLIVCAIGVIDKYELCEHCICEVYNVNTKEVTISKFSRLEIETYRDDVLIPTLDRVKDALCDDKDNIESYRNKCSWCNNFCIYKGEGCKACTSNDKEITNDIPVSLNFYYDMMNDNTRAELTKLIG